MMVTTHYVHLPLAVPERTELPTAKQIIELLMRKRKPTKQQNHKPEETDLAIRL